MKNKLKEKERQKMRNHAQRLMGELFVKQAFKELLKVSSDNLVFSKHTSIPFIRRFFLIMPEGTYKISKHDEKIYLFWLQEGDFQLIRTFFIYK